MRRRAARSTGRPRPQYSSKRSDWCTGSPSQSRPSHRSMSRMLSVSSGRLRSASVSSIRSRNAASFAARTASCTTRSAPTRRAGSPSATGRTGTESVGHRATALGLVEPSPCAPGREIEQRLPVDDVRRPDLFRRHAQRRDRDHGDEMFTLERGGPDGPRRRTIARRVATRSLGRRVVEETPDRERDDEVVDHRRASISDARFNAIGRQPWIVSSSDSPSWRTIRCCSRRASTSA